MNKIKTFNFVYNEKDSVRLDKYLATELKNLNYSRTFISNLIKQEQVLVNDLTINSAKHLLNENDKVTINIKHVENSNTELVGTKISIPIIYEDEDIIVINKPNNLTVHPGAGNKDNTLVNGLIYNMKQLSDLNDETRPGIVHRIDKQTTGLLVVAKNNQAHYFLSEQLKEHKIKRVYIALVHGTISERSGTIDAPIARDVKNRLKMAVSEENSKPAITHFEVLSRFEKYTLVKCELETGRTHQIRVHFQWINHPILNDVLYSKYKIENSEIGQYLHAKEISFIHPTTKKEMHFETNLPDYFEKRLQLLGKENK